ncbi:nuclear cap-binding protein subunit 3-like isoform X2 [Periplaneta americana]|uniref:nuclear cap-binding protein subunit 3-like isoform X2 n=1 Tax=Periplaneta americana TaxID=6978 RepID=UPI0037E94F25
MAIPETSSELPNLKIEIENDLDETMETDDNDNMEDKTSKEEGPEEGELSDSKDTDMDIKAPVFGMAVSTSSEQTWDREKRYENKGGAFVTGVDIFAKEEQNKLSERAKRFGLDPSDMKPITEQQIIDLYKSLGMKDEDGIDKHFRLNALHVRGTEDMSTQDIFNYFKDYGPASIEWINDYSCNVLWLDNLSAARAMIGLSKHIDGLEDFHSKADPFHKVEKEKGSDKENERDEVVVVEEIEEPDGNHIVMVMERPECLDDRDTNEFTEETPMNLDCDVVRASDITIPIPPGKWRKGATHPKAKCILLRFSTRTDKKQPQAEKMSEYYKKYGNPNYGGIKGLITSSRKRRYQRHELNAKVFEDDQGDDRDFKEAMSDDKNPWGNLAKSWSKLDRNRGARKQDSYKAKSPSPPARSHPMTQTNMEDSQGKSILHRIGPVPTSDPHSDSEESSKSSESEEESEWTKRSKIPRMRMYADEEEVRIERRKAQVQAQSRRNTDRNTRNYREKNTKSEDRDRRRRRSGSAHRESSRNTDSSQRRSKTFDSYDREMSKSRDDLRSRLERDGKGRNKGVASIASTVWDRLNDHQAEDTSAWDIESSDSEHDLNDTDLRDSLLQGKKSSSRFEGGDLRSKLNLKKTMRQHIPMQKSPLRIEIDNDEYYRLIGSDQE